MNGLERELKVGLITLSKETVCRASKYIVLTGNDLTDFQSVVNLELLRINVCSGISNDISKYNLGEAYKTSFVWTLNIRSMMNLFELRTDKSALWEFRDLANAMFNALPKDYKFLLQSYIKEYNE